MPLHKALTPISWLGGRWVTTSGHGKFPNIEEFGYHEVLEFSCVATPMPGGTSQKRSNSATGAYVSEERDITATQRSAKSTDVNEHITAPASVNSIRSDPTVVANATANSKLNSKVLLKIVPVTITGPAGAEHTHALLDDGSTVTLIDAELARRTGCSGPITPLSIQGIQENSTEDQKSQMVSVEICGELQSHRIQARTMQNLQLHAQEVKAEQVVEYEHLHDIVDFVTYEKASPKILIGQDNWSLLTAGECRRGKLHEPVATHTSLGWVLHGNYPRIAKHRVNYISTEEERMDEMLRQHFAIESLTIAPKRPQSDPEEKAIKILENSTVQKDNGHFETELLWKGEDMVLPSNYDNAVKRLLNIEKKIDRDPELRDSYNKQMSALVEKGYAELAPTTSHPKRTWYLPHFAVTNPMKPGKVRIVHDAAAKTRGVSLNDHLLTGPDLLQSLPGVLMRFRQHPIAVTADIAEMFMQVKIQERDRDALRFLWRGDERGDATPQQYRMTSLIFGATSSPATAIFVKNINAESHKEQEPAAYDAIVRNHYVDDYLQSFPTEEEATRATPK